MYLVALAIFFMLAAIAGGGPIAFAIGWIAIILHFIAQTIVIFQKIDKTWF